MTALRLLLVSSLLISWLSSAADADPLAVAKITHQRINEQFHILYGGKGLGANVGVLVGDESILLIDTLLEKHNKSLLAAIRQISNKPIRYVINTHSDKDHSGGNHFFAAMGATIIAQANARYSATYGQLYYQDQLTLNFANEQITIHHVESHSFNDSLIYLHNNNALSMGDTFTNTYHPTFYCGGQAGQLATLKLAGDLATASTRIFPGHGYVTDEQGLIAYQQNFVAWMDNIASLSAQGLTIAQMVDNADLKAITQAFNTAQRNNFITPARYQRFIARTLSTDFVTAHSLSAPRQAQAPGRYRKKLIPTSERTLYVQAGLGRTFELLNGDHGAIEGIVRVRGKRRVTGRKLPH